MRILRAIVAAAVFSLVAVAVSLWLWVRSDVARVTNEIDSAQAPVPARVIDAIVAVEDPNFTQRTRGHTLGELHRAIVVAASRRRFDAPVRGASLSEQLVGWEMQGRPISRASRILLVTSIVDCRYANAQIATAYANRVYLGRFGQRRIYGVRSASSSYFGRTPEQLSLAQLASLVAAIKSPSAFSPSATTARARMRRRTVLRRIVSADIATLGEAAAAETELARAGI